MWDIKLQSDAIHSLKHLTKDASKTIFLFLNEYLPKDLSPETLAKAKIKTLKGIHLFSKETSQGVIHLFARVDFDQKVIKVLHVALRANSFDKMQKRKLKKTPPLPPENNT
jgi:mRNA-degrading endonuclease RelE of RelBE toxin-antitoxin system